MGFRDPQNRGQRLIPRRLSGAAPFPRRIATLNFRV